MSAARLVLVGGGARSGKSRFALGRAQQLGAKRVFLATAEPLDEEMRSRIARHRLEREERAGFVTCEEPVAVAEKLSELAAGKDRPTVVLLDCLTLWLSNLLCRGLSAEDVDGRVEALCGALARVRQAGTSVVIVTNEVGLGLVPETPLGRTFRDVAGFAHQRLAERADEIHAALLGRILQLHPPPLVVRSPGAFEQRDAAAGDAFS